MTRYLIAFTSSLFGIFLLASDDKRPSYPSFDYEVARTHEIKPHRGTIPLEGVDNGFNQLQLTLTVSPTGDVLDAVPSGNTQMLKFWPQLKDEVIRWKFVPFETNGKPVTAEVEEYIDIVPPERFPKHHVAAPVVRPNSKISIKLQRTGCLGTCPSYTVTVANNGTVFDGGSVVAPGLHTDKFDPYEVHKLAETFVANDFYSMDAMYRTAVTDSPTYTLAISIDGHTKEVIDYVGSQNGMPAVITELEDAVDELARTERWIEGSDGLVPALKAEKFNFQTFDAQVMVKEAASRGKADTVREFLEAGVPLKPITAPKPKEPYLGVPFENVGWLNAASGSPQSLQVLMNATASFYDQSDKDLALVGAARSGNLESVRALIAYGANPHADLATLTVTESGGGMTLQMKAPGSVLIYSAESGNPDVVRELLRHQPKLDARNGQGRTALFAAGEYRYKDEPGARAECVRLLVEAGADVNARDNDGNTPLHETFLIEVQEELLRLGADVNAQNKNGETPIFTVVNDDAIPLLIKHGADLTIRNNNSETVVEAAKQKGPTRREALSKVMEE